MYDKILNREMHMQRTHMTPKYFIVAAQGANPRLVTLCSRKKEVELSNAKLLVQGFTRHIALHDI